MIVDSRQPLADDLPAVYAAHLAGARAATDHLLGLGHRRIAIITGSARLARHRGARERVSGGTHHRGRPLGAGAGRARQLRDRGRPAAAHALLALPEPPTAIFASNDNMAVGAIQAARERGLGVPGSLGCRLRRRRYLAHRVACVDDSASPLEEMGRMAVSLLTRLLDKQKVETLRVELATRLVLRDSTAPPRTAA